MTARHLRAAFPLLASLAILAAGTAHADETTTPTAPAPAPAPVVRAAVTNAQAEQLERDIAATECGELATQLLGAPTTVTALTDHLRQQGLPGKDLNLTAAQEKRLIKATTERAVACNIAVDDRSFSDKLSSFVTGSLGITGSSLLDRLGVKFGSGSSEELSSASSSTLTSS